MEPGIWLEKGGIVIWVLAGVFVLGLAVGIERLLYFLLSSLVPEQVEAGLEAELADSAAFPGDLDRRLAGRLRGTGGGRSSYRTRLLNFQLVHSPLLRMVRTFLAVAETPRESRKLRLERTGAELIAEMKRRIGLLAVIGAVAPLLGLLGTVTGMMHSFQEIAVAAGQADMGALAAGIWEAMITTAGGLVVAIFALLAHGSFTTAINRRIRSMNALVAMLEEKIFALPSDARQPAGSSNGAGQVRVGARA